MSLRGLFVLLLLAAASPYVTPFSVQKQSIGSFVGARVHGKHAFEAFRQSKCQLPLLPRGKVVVRSAQARVVDMEDTQSIAEMEMESSLENSDAASLELAESFEQSLDTAGIDAELREILSKALNALFLVGTFGWAFYTILNIDAGMTRGWTQGEIAMRIPLDNWSNYESSLMEKPIFTKTLINVIIYLLGDWLSQTVFQKKNVLDFDVSRTLKNGLIGLAFGPIVHQYYQFSDHILPVTGLQNRVLKILMDQTIYLTVKCSIYISAVGLLSGDDWDTCKTNVKEKIGGVVITAWKFWPLIHCITYGVIPARHRILWVNSVDLIWNAILASKAQKVNPEEEKTDSVEDSIKESARLIVTSSETADHRSEVHAVQAESLSAVTQHADDDAYPTVQDVSLTGCSIEIPEDGVPVLVADDEEETKIPLSATTATDSKLAP